MKKNVKEIVIYQAKSGQIEFRGDFDRDKALLPMGNVVHATKSTEDADGRR